MDAYTIATALAASVLVSGAVTFIVMRELNRRLQLQIEELTERLKFEFGELTQRRSAASEQEVQVLEDMVFVLYSLRGTVRFLSSRDESEWPEERLHELLADMQKFEELFLKNMPLFYTKRHQVLAVFDVRSGQGTVRSALNYLDYLPEDDADERRKMTAIMRRAMASLEVNYGELLNLVQTQLAVREYTSAPHP